MKEVPFKHHGVNATRSDANTRHRLKVYRKFMGLDSLRGIHSLDIGEPGYISRALEVDHNTMGGDFNYHLYHPGAGYEVVTCFEVLNHVMNPLFLMQRILDAMAPGGVCYLSVPKLWLISWHHCRYNFVMYDPKRLKVLFEYAGFEVVRSETRNPWPLYFVFYGFRPILRVLLNRIQVFELRRPR